LPLAGLHLRDVAFELQKNTEVVRLAWEYDSFHHYKDQYRLADDFIDE